MHRHSIALATALALAGTATPAFAQDTVYQMPAPVAPVEGQVQVYQGGYPGGPGPYAPTQYPMTTAYPQQAPYPQQTWVEEPRGLPPLPGEYRPAYSEAERDAWLDSCRSGAYRDTRGEGGGVIGGVLGAVAGGIIGNRSSKDERLGATLIGAGVGGLAGLAIGAAIDAATARRHNEDVIDECEAYLRQYEAGYARPAPQPQPYPYPQPAYGYGYGYAYPVMMVRVPIMTERVPRECDCREEIVEEWIEEVPETKTVRVIETKTVPVKTVPVKTVPVKTTPIKTRSIKSVK